MVVSLVESHLVNDPFGDPGLYVDFRFDRRALLFDLGELQTLPQRKLLRVSHVFVSHTHLDHFNGFDRLLRICLGRPMSLRLFGPPGFIDRVHHKLGAYTWNLIAENEVDFVIAVAEFDGRKVAEAGEFHSRDAFLRRGVAPPDMPAGVLLDEEDFQIRGTMLDHGIASLAFAFAEKLRVNVWKDRLDRMGLAVGPWLKEAKRAVRRGDPDDTPIAALRMGKTGPRAVRVSLGDLKADAFRLAPGATFAYVVDTSYHEQNAIRIIELARNADTLFIEAVFLDEDKEIAARKRHLTAAQAGAVARRAAVKRLVPFHFSPRYRDQKDRLRREAEDAFVGIIDADGGRGADALPKSVQMGDPGC
jgi:ribonuclease Z